MSVVKQIRNYAVIGTRVFIINYLYEGPEMRARSTFASILPIKLLLDTNFASTKCKMTSLHGT